MAKKCLYAFCKRDQFGGGYCPVHQYCRTDGKHPKPLNNRKKKKKGKKDGRLKKLSDITIPLMNRAKIAFNLWIRKRDQWKGCISCPGKSEQAGHYFPSGLYPALRFHEMNVNGQCEKCNCYKHGNVKEYRNGLIRRYGLDRVEKLEAEANESRVYQWSDDELRKIIKKYAV